MALLWDASLTDAGVSMISQWAQGTGNKLTITGGVIGEGVVAATQLHALTQLTDQKSTISIQGFESVANGVKLKLRKTSQGITTSFILNQIGIYAKLDTSGGTPIIADSLIAVYQQDTGVLVPTEADSPDFVFTFYGTVQTNYSGDLTINVDTSALASQNDLDALTLAGLADTDADTPAEDNLLFFKGSTDKWTAQANPFSNENLVDNGWFTVNQRGFTSGSGTSLTGQYPSDRWLVPAADPTSSITVDSNGITLGGESYVRQYIDKKPILNRQFTLSAELQNGDIVSAQGTTPATTPSAYTEIINLAISGTASLTFAYNANQTKWQIQLATTSGTSAIRAVKLELGTVSTLANDVAPDYAFELAKCRASTADPSDTYANKGGLVHNAEMTSLYVTGSTNTTGATITNGTFFYLNGSFCKATADIAVNAAFTENTNYKKDTVGANVTALNGLINGSVKQYANTNTLLSDVGLPIESRTTQQFVNAIPKGIYMCPIVNTASDPTDIPSSYGVFVVFKSGTTTDQIGAIFIGVNSKLHSFSSYSGSWTTWT